MLAMVIVIRYIRAIETNNRKEIQNGKVQFSRSNHDFKYPTYAR